MSGRSEIEDAIKAEVEEFWPGVSVEFGEGGKHPKAKLSFGGNMLATPYSGTPSDTNAPAQAVRSVRRTLKRLGAERTKPEPTEAEDRKRYCKPNEGRARRPDPVARERGPIMVGIADQMADHPTAAMLPAIPINQEKREPVVELEPLGIGAWDIDADRYHADPCPEPSLSASIAKIAIQKSLYHAWYGHPRLNAEYEESTSILQHRIGRAFHAMLLGKGAPVEVFGHKDWKKDIAKADRDNSLANGCTPLLEHQFENIERMVRAAKRQISGREELAYAMAGGVPERVFIWQEETPAGPIWCRMMADWTPHAGPYAVDWKTTAASAGPEDWGQRTMWDMGCEIQDAFYRRGFKAVLGIEYDALIFAVIEADEPHALMHHRVMPETQAAAEMDVKWAIRAWGLCLKHGRWPGYPKAMAWQERPGWRSGRVESKWESGQRDLEALIENLESMKSIQPRLEGAEVTADNPFGLSEEEAK